MILQEVQRNFISSDLTTNSNLSQVRKKYFFKFFFTVLLREGGGGLCPNGYSVTKGGATLKNEFMNYEYIFAPKEYEICLGKSMMDGRR